jgi:hypothetical protein
VARIMALLITVVLFWGVVITVIGADAKPGGQLFNIAVLVISAYLGGWVLRMLTLPALVGMLLVGIFYQNAGLISIEGKYKGLVSVLRYHYMNINKNNNNRKHTIAITMTIIYRTQLVSLDDSWLKNKSSLFVFVYYFSFFFFELMTYFILID